MESSHNNLDNPSVVDMTMDVERKANDDNSDDRNREETEADADDMIFFQAAPDKEDSQLIEEAFQAEEDCRTEDNTPLLIKPKDEDGLKLFSKMTFTDPNIGNERFISQYAKNINEGLSIKVISGD